MNFKLTKENYLGKWLKIRDYFRKGIALEWLERKMQFTYKFASSVNVVSK